MRRVTEEWAHRKCGWKHSAKGSAAALGHDLRAATSALTNSAFSWKFAGRIVRGHAPPPTAPNTLLWGALQSLAGHCLAVAVALH
jgi:hypothetical protein